MVNVLCWVLQENMDMYSRVKRRKSMRRNPFGVQAHHKALSKKESPAEDEEGENSEGKTHAHTHTHTHSEMR